MRMAGGPINSHSRRYAIRSFNAHLSQLLDFGSLDADDASSQALVYENAQLRVEVQSAVVLVL